MHLKKLDISFYIENTHLVEVLDYVDGKWLQNKTRGYGIVIIRVGNLTFGIPLRSRIRHDASYVVVRSNMPGVKGKGLDFSKAVLLAKPTYISSSPFRIPDSEHVKLREKENHIQMKFEKYVNQYISATQLNHANILSRFEFRTSTLINYHKELGIDIKGAP